MAATQVILYFDNRDDAVLFTVAASSVMSTQAQMHNNGAVNVAKEICKATRITTAGVLNLARRRNNR